MSITLTNDQYHHLCEYLKKKAPNVYSAYSIQQQAQDDLGHNISVVTVRKAAKLVGLPLVREPASRSEQIDRIESEMDHHASRLRWIEFAINHMARELDIDLNPNRAGGES